MNNNEYTFYVTKKLNNEETNSVLKINQENLSKNGGQLHYEGILPYDYAILVKHKDEVIGYALTFGHYFTNSDIYIMQVAINKKFQHCGIGSHLYNYLYEHSKGFKYVTSNASPENTVSCNFHQKMGFEHLGENGDGHIYGKPVTKKITKTFNMAKPLTINIQTKEAEERIL